MKNRIPPVDTLFSKIIFSVFTRLALCVWLFFADPFSVTFPWLLVIIFCIPLARYALHKATRTRIENDWPEGTSARVALFLAMALVYIFVVPHILWVYTDAFLGFLWVMLLPFAAVYLLYRDTLKKMDQKISDEKYLMITMAFYILPFLAGINYVFDFSRPAIQQYYVTGAKEYMSPYTSNPDEAVGPTWYLSLLPVDGTAPHWVEVSEAEYRNINLGEGTTIQGTHCRVLDMERRLRSVKAATPAQQNGVAPTYYVLVLETNAEVMVESTREEIYKRFTQGDTMYLEMHHGLLGLPWRSYKNPGHPFGKPGQIVQE